MKKIVFILMAIVSLLGSAQSTDMKFVTHYSQTHSLYDAGMYVAKTETIVGDMGCNVIEIDNKFEYDGTTFVKDKGDEYEVIYDVIDTRIVEGKVFVDAGTHRTYVLTAKEREQESTDQIILCIVKDGKNKQNIIVTVIRKDADGIVVGIDTYTQIRE